MDNEERIGKTLVDNIKSDANDTFWSDSARDLRDQIKSIEFSLDYLQYQIYRLTQKRIELLKFYREELGLESEVKNEQSKA